MQDDSLANRYYLETELCKGVSMDTGVAYPKSDGSSGS